MKQVLYVLLLFACAGLGVLGVKGCQMFEQWRNSGGFSHYSGHLVTGVGDAPGFRGFTLNAPPAEAGKLFAQWRGLFATTVGIQYSDAWSREILTAVTKAAHDNELAVILLPPTTGSATNPYPRQLAEIGADAQAAKIDRVCISWLNVDPDPEYWRDQATRVRKAYGGKVILAAMPDVAPRVECWDACDFIGIAGPIELPKRLPHATDVIELHDFRVMWDCRLTELSAIGTFNHKKVAILNVEVPRAVSFKLPIPGNAPAKMPENAALQSMVYEALLLETKGRAEFIDIMLLTWGDAANRAAVNQVPGLLGKVTEAWDPKKPKVAETLPEIPEPPGDEPAELPAGELIPQ